MLFFTILTQTIPSTVSKMLPTRIFTTIKNGFVVSFNSSNDRVLGFLSTNLQNWKRNIYYFFDFLWSKTSILGLWVLVGTNSLIWIWKSIELSLCTWKNPISINIGAAQIWIMKLILPLAKEATKTAVDNLEFEIFPREKNYVLVNEQTPLM